MSDPQDGLKRWLSEKLRDRGAGSGRELAEVLRVPADAVTRMKNRDGAKESRRIEAQHVPEMARFFGEWPPGFDHPEARGHKDMTKQRPDQQPININRNHEG